MTRKSPDVCFVVAPFLPEHQPALGVSSLKAALEAAGYSCTILYLNIDYARRIGFGPSSHIGGGLPVEILLGEMVFASALWGEAGPSWPDYEARVRQWFASDFGRRSPLNLDELMDAARPLHLDAPQIVEQWVDQIEALGPRIVGFTTTFQQNLASLAIARGLRRRVPEARTAIFFGGANCEADMGKALAENFLFIDRVVSGEGEGVIVDLVAEVFDGRDGADRYRPGPIIRDMDALPIPAFADYFDAIVGTEMEAKFNLVAESSRGCWWGMKSHCTFCGLNGTSMGYRSKDPRRFGEELRTLRGRYGSSSFMLADNIMDMSYLRTLFPSLVADGEPVELFYETKANLRKEQLEMMAAAGISRLQPGIESLSTPLLKLMGKGTSLLQNLQVLKWCAEFDVGLAWNILMGFPGEDPIWYARMTELVPHLHHLPPPTGAGLVRLDRFSPFWAAPERHGMKDVRPFWSYEYAYAGLPPDQRARIAYYFEFDYAAPQRPIGYTAPLSAAVATWQSAQQGGAALEFALDGDGPIIVDTRNGAERRTQVAAIEREMLRRFDRAGNSTVIADLVPDAAERARLLDTLVGRGWLIRENELHLSLVVDRRERERVLARRVALRLESLGLDPELYGAAA